MAQKISRNGTRGQGRAVSFNSSPKEWRTVSSSASPMERMEHPLSGSWAASEAKSGGEIAGI